MRPALEAQSVNWLSPLIASQFRVDSASQVVDNDHTASKPVILKSIDIYIYIYFFSWSWMQMDLKV